MNPIDRRAFLLGMLGVLVSLPVVAVQPRALREMWIRKVPELGLEVWLEHQPPWSARLMTVHGRPQLVAQSPDAYHPPAVITISSWPEQRVPPALLEQVADAAIRQGSLNFGLNKHRSRQIVVKPAAYGVLSGFEGSFVGLVQGTAMDVKIFVGQQTGQFPVVLTVYTLQGKMPFLSEVVRRSFTKLRYL